MKIVSSLAIQSLLLLFLTNSACAGVRNNDNDISISTMTSIVAWVEQATKVQIKQLPTISISNEKLQAALKEHGLQKALAAGAYLPGRVYISEDIWNKNSALSQSFIVHELVHHTQFLNHRHYPCSAAKEREAYMLQNQWLAEHNLPPLVSQKWIDHISSCSSSYLNANQ